MNPLKVQFGSGGNILDGWVNHDAEVDITKPLPYADNSVDFILAEHCAEHISGPDVLRFFDECRRILKSGGVLRVCVPSLFRVDKAKARDLVLNHGHLMVFYPDTLKRLLVIAGFGNVVETGRNEIDGHWKIIGKEQDDLETIRVEATKT